MNDLQVQLVERFGRRFGSAPSIVVRAPGRVNLIGDHTDYNDGFVLPMAIDRAAWIALRPRTDRHVAVHALSFDSSAEFTLDAYARPSGHEAPSEGWVEYVRGVAWALSMAGMRLTGWEGVMAGDVPLGAGLSSSAALELATARAFAAVSQLQWNATEMAQLAQRAENQWVGVNCGIMDQLISAVGEAGHALLIDCRSLETLPVPLPSETAVVVLDTATRRGLVDSAYNERRAQCEAAAQFFGVEALRDVDQETFDARAAQLDPTTRRRARHVITENARVLAAAEALTHHDIARVGALMNESHASLRDDFEVSRTELDTMVALAQRHAGCYGARMTGAGFGGCAVALVDHAATRDFVADLTRAYHDATKLDPALYVCVPSQGASVVNP